MEISLCAVAEKNNDNRSILTSSPKNRDRNFSSSIGSYLSYCHFAERIRIIPLKEQFYSVWCYLLAFLVQLNVYTETNDDSPDVRRNQILSTRVFLVSITLAMVGLTGYTAQMQTITLEVNNPSQYDYERLEKLYGDTLTCPCSRLAVPAGSFVTVSATFHQVC